MVGQRVAVWPLQACGECYPCSVGRPNTCDCFELIGIHVDGGLQELLARAGRAGVPDPVDDPGLAALAEPVSIAVRAVVRARIQAGERVVVLGAGPIGQCICLVARERGAEVLVVDLQESRLGLSRSMGADTLVWTAATRWFRTRTVGAAPGGPPVAVDATGAPVAVRAMVDMVASAGRAVQVGMSGEEVTLRIGSLTEKELDVLGVSVCGGEEFREAVAVVERNAAARAADQPSVRSRAAPDAIRFAIDNPTEVMKVVIGGA